ncbi:RHS repeat-associated core domain-containing protein [uncultured Chryseobacterium sp.]|uniref:RHS repeat-associated core domain-containing protein n=1 Tax=uncultured Chryseobacterium sp. TaxID=259322 RepID=UPI00339001FE
MKKFFGGLQTDYLDGFQYKFTYAWEDETGTMTSDGMKLRIIPTAEGYFDGLRNRYFYNYTDHLGNVRLSYSDADGNGQVTGDIVVNNCYDTPDGQVCNNYIITGEAEGVTNYYPFGLMHNAQSYSFDNAYNYKYNGKELQETGMYDYGARFYMPDLGRWGVVDPLAETSRRWSVYTYAYNNPIRFIDPDGMENKDVILKGDKVAEAFEQLKNAASNLNLKMDASGKVTGTVKRGAKVTDAEATLLRATKNKSVVISVTAQSSNIIESDNTAVSGGAFRGSTINSSLDASLEGSPSKITHASQVINPTDLGEEDTFYDATKGVGVMHEILESYIGAINSPGAINIVGSQNMEFGRDAYNDAHNTANELDTRINYGLKTANTFLPRTSDGTLRIERSMYKVVNGVKIVKPLKTIEVKRK